MMEYDITSTEAEPAYQAQLKGEPIWVKFVKNGDPKSGSIGQLTFPANTVTGARTDYGNGQAYWYLYTDFSADISFPGTKHRSFKVKLRHFHNTIKGLRGYTGPAVRENNTEQGPLPVIKDQFGEIIKQGDFIVYASYGNVRFATVNRITHSKRVYITTMDGSESYIIDTAQIAIIDGNLRKRAMIRKLSR